MTWNALVISVSFLHFVPVASAVACLIPLSDLHNSTTPNCLWYAMLATVYLSLPSLPAGTNHISYKLVLVWQQHFIFVLLMVQVVSNHRGWGSVPGQVVWDCWWTKWHCDRFISKYSILCSPYHSASAWNRVIYLSPCCV